MNALHENILTAQDIWLGYQPGKNLVSSSDIAVRKGEMIAAIGRNGSGKSTLLRTIAGIQEPLKGEVLLGNIPISSYRAGKLASLVSFVGTGMNSPGNLTVFETVSMGRHPYTNWWGRLSKEDTRKVMQSIRFVGMTDMMNRNLDILSDGERQRVMIAMALAQDTRIIIMDEPTAFLDIPNRMEVVEVLCNMKNAGKSVIFSTHDFDSAIMHADKLWLLHQQKIIQGAPEDLGLAEMFDAIFNESNIKFDAVNLRFKRTSAFNRSIVFKEGNNPAGRWTVRMLERIGFRVLTEGNETYPRIILKGSKNKPVWHIDSSGFRGDFDSLYEVAGYLAQNL